MRGISSRIRIAVVASVAIVLLEQASRAAAQINFRSVPGSTNYTSAGAPVQIGSGYVFELGAFESGFTPGAANTAEWAERFTPLGRANYNDSTKWFTGVAFLEDNSAPFTFGAAAFIWGHNSDGEWILISNPGWTWPAATGGIGNPGGITFSVSQAATVANLGAVNEAGFQMMTAAANGEIPDVVPQQWFAQHFSPAELEDPEITGLLVDPDNDGAPNIMELAAGTDPEDPLSVSEPEFTLVEDSGATFLQVSLSRAGRALMSHVLATSSNLEDWDLSGSGVNVIEDSSTILILRATGAVGMMGREFYQFILDLPDA